MQLQVLEGCESVPNEDPSVGKEIAVFAAHASAALCWTASGVAALADETKLMVAYGVAAVVLTLVSLRSQAERIRRRISRP